MAAVVVALLFCFQAPLLAYVRDHHYQSHFLFLWAFFAAALIKDGRGAFCRRVPLDRRTCLGFALGVVALMLFWGGSITGSSTVQRLALVGSFAAWLVTAARGWPVARCLGYGTFALLCFGLPYSAYFQVTKVFRQVFVAALEWLPTVLPLGYTVDGLALQFPHYRLAITADCSGFNQLLTFLGIAFLGIMTGRPSRRRAVLLICAGTVLALLSNLARILVFVLLVSLQQFQFIDNAELHAAVGLVAYAPFILLFLWMILASHRPHRRAPRPLPPARGLPVVAALLPLLAVRLITLQDQAVDPREPALFAGIDAPPGCEVRARAPTEAYEREVYETPWLVNVTHADGDGHEFELFAYVTRGRRHLAVHQISQCLDTPGTRVEYGPPVEVGGHMYWTLELIGPEHQLHGYFAFHIEGENRDDSLSTQLEVLGRRLLGGVPEVGLTRFLMPGPLRLPVPPRDRRWLAWRSELLDRAAAAGVAAFPPGR